MSFFFRFTFLWFVFALAIQSAAAQSSDGYYRLDDALKVAYQNSPTLMAAREELHKTLELYPQARAGWLPTLTGEASIYATDVESSNFSNGDGATTKDMTLNLDQPIWRGGKTFAETARAHDLIRAGEATLKQAQQDLFFNTATVYMDVLRDEGLVRLRKKNEDILLQELHSTSERLEIGDTTRTDLQQAKARLSRAKSERIQAEMDLKISKARFEEITGIPTPDHMMLPAVRFELPQSLDEMVEIAEKHNPELIIAKFEHSAAEHNVDAVFRELLPQISAFASFNRQYDPQPGIVEDSESKTIGLRANIAFFQGGSVYSRQREARHSALRQAYKIKEIQQRIRQSLISNWRSYQAAQAQTESRQDEIRAAQAALEGVREEARIGQRTVLDVLDADQELIDAKAALANARRNETVALFALRKNLGDLKFEP